MFLKLNQFFIEKAMAQTILPDGSPQDWTLDQFSQMIDNSISIALNLAGIVATIFIVIGGYQYLTAYGSEDKATAGKNTLTWAIIGLVFIIVSKIILGQVWKLFTGGPAPI